MGFSANLRRLRDKAGLTGEELAARCGFAAGQSRIGNYEKAKADGSPTREPKFADLVKLSEVLNCTIDELLENDALAVKFKPDPFADIRGYSQAVGLGAAGAEAQEYAEAHKLKFRASSLSRKGLRPDKLAVFYGKGDSMLPRVHPGDAILFDTTDTKPKDDTLYVIQVHGLANPEYQVKRSMVLDGETYFMADNPAGDHAWIKPRKVKSGKHEIIVLGRVRWIGSWED